MLIPKYQCKLVQVIYVRSEKLSIVIDNVGLILTSWLQL